MTGAVAGVTITGTIYGATLKSDQDVKKVDHPCLSLSYLLQSSCSEYYANTNSLQQKKLVLEATPDERIAQLEVARNDLVAKKNEMERKIAVFHARRAKEEEGK